MPRRTKERETRRKSKKNNNKINKNNIKQDNVDETNKNNKFSFDEEIVIGLRRIDDEPKTNDKAKKVQKQSKKKVQKSRKKSKEKNAKHIDEPELIIKSKYMENYENIDRVDNYTKNSFNKKNRKKTSKTYKAKMKKEIEQDPKAIKKKELSRKRRKFVFKIFKIIVLIGIIIAGIIFALLSPIFNVKEIRVIGNSKISTDTIISLSGLKSEHNIFDFKTSNVVDAIKQNAYVDTVDVQRKLPDIININVVERVATYILKFGNAYVYINNQGYILEITNKEANYPIITNYETPEEQIKEGNRLCSEDLEKLNDVLKIIEAASVNNGEIKKLITQINIENKSNYILTLQKEKKQVYIGDTTNLSTKMLWIDKFLEEEKDNEGIIFLNIDLNNVQPYFREKV